ncbi:MAG: Chromate resistance protein ChrB [Acidimicrobiales bacterium]
MSDPIRWLVLVYRVPSEPTRLRAAVWRRLKALGAVYLQSSVAALPASAATERALRGLRKEIVEHMGGRAVLFGGSALVGEADVVGATNEARDDEYEEIVDRAQDFLSGIDKEIAARHLTYGELEENEEDLTKLRGWYDKVRARDALGASGAERASGVLQACAEALEGFAALVYEAEEY